MQISTLLFAGHLVHGPGDDPMGADVLRAMESDLALVRQVEVTARFEKRLRFPVRGPTVGDGRFL